MCVLCNLVICDPPVFASAGKGKSFHVENEWPELVRHISEIVVPGGVALFSNNHQAGSEFLFKLRVSLYRECGKYGISDDKTQGKYISHKIVNTVREIIEFEEKI